MKKEKNIDRRLYGFTSTGPDKVYDGKIHAINLGYSIDKNLKHEEAKNLFYELADSLIKEINSHTELSDLFYHYPIGYEDLSISLSFDYDLKENLKIGDVHSIYIKNNKILYNIINSEKPKKIIKKEIVSDIWILERCEDNKYSIIKELPELD